MVKIRKNYATDVFDDLLEAWIKEQSEKGNKEVIESIECVNSCSDS